MDPMHGEGRDSPKCSHLVRSIIHAASVLCLIVFINITLTHVSCAVLDDLCKIRGFSWWYILPAFLVNIRVIVILVTFEHVHYVT